MLNKRVHLKTLRRAGLSITVSYDRYRWLWAKRHTNESSFDLAGLSPLLKSVLESTDGHKKRARVTRGARDTFFRSVDRANYLVIETLSIVRILTVVLNRSCDVARRTSHGTSRVTCQVAGLLVIYVYTWITYFT
jgi:hypothetical protein